jgi:ADP-ribose pyrophosphatase
MSERSATVLSTQTVHAGRVFTTTRDRIQLPDGRETTMDVIRHQPSVILLPMPDSAHIVLVRQYRYAIDRWIWELPAGNVEPGEDIETAARRECHEEIGQVPDRIERLAEVYPTPGYSDEVMIFFRLVGLSVAPEPANLDEDEILEPQLFAVADVKARIERGEIRDMKTALGMSYCTVP